MTAYTVPSNDEIQTRLKSLEQEFGEEITLDGLTADFKIFQRRRGHRHSTDDLLTAWYATQHGPNIPVKRLLDLGTGIGSVGLGVAWYFRDADLTAVEVQEISYRLLRENIWVNSLENRTRTIHGDLRDSVPNELFDLITGSPPYFDVKDGIVSSDPQRAGARFELRGTVFDYCRAAVKALHPDGHFVFCFPTNQKARAIKACEEASLRLFASCDVIPRKGIAALFSLFACQHPNAPQIRSFEEQSPLCVRNEKGVHTPEMLAARAVFGMH